MGADEKDFLDDGHVFRGFFLPDITVPADKSFDFAKVNFAAVLPLGFLGNFHTEDLFDLELSSLEGEENHQISTLHKELGKLQLERGNTGQGHIMAYSIFRAAAPTTIPTTHRGLLLGLKSINVLYSKKFCLMGKE